MLVDSSGVGWSGLLRRSLQEGKGLIPWSDVKSVSFLDGTAVSGALAWRAGRSLAARNSLRDTHLTVHKSDGTAVTYQIIGVAGPAVRAMIQPFLAAAGVPCVNELAANEPAPIVLSIADELSKLVSLTERREPSRKMSSTH